MLLYCMNIPTSVTELIPDRYDRLFKKSEINLQICK